MNTIYLLSQKGGSGKTTLALSLAAAAEKTGQQDLIVDLDPQATACKCGDRRKLDGPIVIGAQPAVPSQESRHEQARAAIEGLGILVCSVTIGQRAASGDAGTLGLSVLEYDSSGRASLETLQVCLPATHYFNQRGEVPCCQGKPSGQENYNKTSRKVGLPACRLRLPS